MLQMTFFSVAAGNHSWIRGTGRNVDDGWTFYETYCLHNTRNRVSSIPYFSPEAIFWQFNEELTRPLRVLQHSLGNNCCCHVLKLWMVLKYIWFLVRTTQPVPEPHLARVMDPSIDWFRFRRLHESFHNLSVKVSSKTVACTFFRW